MVTFTYMCGPPRPAPTARSDILLKQSAPGIRTVCFKSSSQQPATHGRHGPLPRPALTNFCNIRHQESLPFVSKVLRHVPGGLSRPSVPSRPTVTDFCNRRRQESVPFVSKVRPGCPSRPSVHRLETIGARNRCLSRTSVTVRSHEPLKQTVPHTGE